MSVRHLHSNVKSFQNKVVINLESSICTCPSITCSGVQHNLGMWAVFAFYQFKDHYTRLSHVFLSSSDTQCAGFGLPWLALLRTTGGAKWPKPTTLLRLLGVYNVRTIQQLFKLLRNGAASYLLSRA
jgi:hypothetical protein